jgi:ribosomal protein L37AE/L43A
MNTKTSRRHKKKSCKNKIGFNTKNGAHISMHIIKRKNLIFHQMKVYKCRYCHKWHVGRINKVDYTQFDKLIGSY